MKEQESHKSEIAMLTKKLDHKLATERETQLKESGLRILEAEEALREA